MRYALPFILLAGPAWADLNARQQQAFDAILPAVTQAVVEQGGEELAPFAPILATCVAENAKRREIGALRDGVSPEDEALLTEIMARAEVQGCVATAATQ
ncbi:MAG: hypothetical protein ACU0DW_07900 [Shimia sp.]